MRDFFKRILDNFHLYSGNRPLEKLSDEEVTMLLNILCRVSKNYEYIPEAEQQKIIEGQLIADRTYHNLNARTVAGWLELNGKKYFKEEAHVPTEGNAKPLEGKERDEAIQVYLTAIANATNNFERATTKGNGARMREQLETAGVTHEIKDQEVEKERLAKKESGWLEDYCAKPEGYCEKCGGELAELEGNKHCNNCDKEFTP